LWLSFSISFHAECQLSEPRLSFILAAKLLGCLKPFAPLKQTKTISQQQQRFVATSGKKSAELNIK